jgi:hypothetical protein
VAILAPRLVFLPIPLSGVVPATVIGLIALAYLEEDGFLLSIGLLAAIIVLMVEFAAVWAIVRGAKWIDRWVSMDSIEIEVGSGVVSGLLQNPPAARLLRFRAWRGGLT